MQSRFRRLIPLTLSITLLLGACSGPEPRPEPRSATTHASAAAEATAPSPTANPSATTQPPSDKPLQIENRREATGIAACDDYLASYKGCHRAAGIFSPTTIDEHYQEMHDNLVKLSIDPNMRDTLAARCTALANQLKKALHGKACDAEPSAASSSGN